VNTLVLVVDDDAALARLVLQLVCARGFGEGRHVTTGREALETLDGVDIVLLDQQLPDTTGLDLLETIRARANPPSVVLITAHGNESLAADALRLGAVDYLAKDQALLDRLPEVLERVRRGRELRKALAAAERDLVRAERLAAMGEMMVALHHGINNPLMAASTEIELLLAESGIAEHQRESLGSVQISLRRIGDIVKQIGDLRSVQTKPYLPGIRMVDLDEGSTAEIPALHRGTALVQVTEEDMARIVMMLLRHAGFAVERCDSSSALQARVIRRDVALVVMLGGTAAGGAHALGGFDPATDRAYRVVALVAGDGQAASRAGADRVVALPFDPGEFTADMIDLVS
jgi:DNA-binding response OmpR family regulator